MSNRNRLVVWAAVVSVLAVPLAVAASDAFTNVPDSNVHHDNIGWLKDADVTRGCNPPANTEFCPDQPVLRQQMASFMRRLAENQVVDAGTLGGLAVDEIVQGYAESGSGSTTGTLNGLAKLEEIQIEVPEDGYLQIIGSTSIFDNDGGTMVVWLQLDDTTCNNTSANFSSVGFGYGSTAGGNSIAGGAMGEGTVPVTAGTHTISLCAFNIGGPASVLAPSITALFLKNATVSVGLASDDPGDLPLSD